MTWDPTLDPDALAARIDHTLLQPDATEERIRKMLGEARALGVAGACVAPCWLPVATEVLAGTAVRVVAVVGFPLGSTLPRVKAFETREAVRLGADEIDAVVQIGWLASGRREQVIDDVRAVVEAADGRPVKAILETGLLSPSSSPGPPSAPSEGAPRS